MGGRTDFEIRRSDGAWSVFSMSSTWGRDNVVRTAFGLMHSVPFATAPLAKAWVEEQFEIPLSRWRRRHDGTPFAGKGDPFPEGCAASMPPRKKKANPKSNKPRAIRRAPSATPRIRRRKTVQEA
jgi:hypothetical protein